VDKNWYVASTGDYDGDGRADTHWRDQLSGRNVLWAAAAPAASRELAAAGGGWNTVPYEGEPVQPVVMVQLPSVMEGNVDSTASAWVVMSHESIQPVDWGVSYSLDWDPGAPLFASFGEDLDLAGPSAGRLSAGATRAEIPLRIHGDATPETNEGIYPLYLAASNAVALWAWEGTGRIGNDDANTIWLTGPVIWEGNAGTHPATFHVWLSRPQATPVTVSVETYQGTGVPGTPGVDYVARSVTGAVIPAGATHLGFDVSIIGDTAPEPLTEGLNVRLTSVEGIDNVMRNDAFVYIFDDDLN
jgi:hypothetical protein